MAADCACRQSKGHQGGRGRGVPSVRAYNKKTQISKTTQKRYESLPTTSTTTVDRSPLLDEMREPSMAVREAASEHIKERQIDYACSKPVVYLANRLAIKIKKFIIQSAVFLFQKGLNHVVD